MTPQQAALSDVKRSGLSVYRELAAGKASLWEFARGEIIQSLFSTLGGLVGLATRAAFYPKLFRRCGRRPAFGKGVSIRVPRNISLGSGVLVDDYATLDVRGDEASISLGDRVSIGRFSIVAAKYGSIDISAGCNIGSSCRVATNSRVFLGESVLVGAYCYIGPGNHTEGDDDQPLIARPMDIRGGVEIGEHAWLGARVTVLDGVTIGKHAIIGAHSLVTSDVPDWGVAVGTPAKVIKIRKPHSVEPQERSEGQ